VVGVGVVVICQHVKAARFIFGYGEGVVGGDGHVVDVINVDRNRAHVLAAVAVRDGVGERFHAGEVCRRCVEDDAAVRGRHAALVGVPNVRNGQRVAFHVAVVVQHV